MEAEAEVIEIQVKFQKDTHSIRVSRHLTLAELKVHLYERYSIRPEVQKLMGVKHEGKPPSHDGVKLHELSFTISKGASQLMLLGTPENKIMKEPEKLSVRVFNDLDLDFKPAKEFLDDVHYREERLQNIIKENTIPLINPLDPQKKLLVLDLDKTLFDFSSRHKTRDIYEVMRPHLISFLTEAYRSYNLAVWSATAWTWVEIKLTELGLLQNSNFKFSFVLDKGTMIDVKTQVKRDEVLEQEVKPLAFIWHHLPQFSPKNTAHVDDLVKNFEMNPLNGIVISKFKLGTEEAAADVELVLMARYLTHIASLNDLSLVDHSKWRSVALALPRQ